MINIFEEFVGKEEQAKEYFKDFPEVLCTKLNIEKLSLLEQPIRQTEFAAAYDLSLPYTVTIFPGETRELLFGWKLLLEDVDGDPSEFIQGVILARSSLAKKKGLILTGGYEIIHDQGCLKASFKNITKEAVLIEEGERIAQLCLVHQFSVKEVHNFSCMEKISNSEIEADLPSYTGEEFSFAALSDVELIPGKVTVLPTGIKCKLKEDEVLFLRTTLDTYTDVILANGIGVVDADYYDNESNEGAIGFLLINMGYVPYIVRKGTIIGKGWISSYLKLKGDQAGGERTGGFGSTSS